VRGHAIRGDVLVHLTFHRLPSIRPEPALIGRDRQDGLQFDHPVFPFDDPDLCSWLVKVHATAPTV